jgi:Ni,Fe-hydrogenase III small subunit/NAD-dependent dihydropyrimidine dehydrogenase PreA subunit
MAYPDGPPPELPLRFRGRPEIDPGSCRDGCRLCEAHCPTRAITADAPAQIDLGRCLFCSDCVEACPTGAITFTRDHRLAVRRRDELVVHGGQETLPLAAALGSELRRLLGRSLKLRQVSAGGCNGCELDTNVLNTVGWDLTRFGVQFVASPRHADGMLITGAISRNMRVALQKTYVAIPPPKIVIAVGACAIGGGPFVGHAEVSDGAVDLVPIDLFVPGCPPHPLTILDGILRLLGRVKRETPSVQHGQKNPT